MRTIKTYSKRAPFYNAFTRQVHLRNFRIQPLTFAACLDFLTVACDYVVVSSRCGTRLREQQASEETTHETMVALVRNPRLGNPVLCCYDDLLGIRHVCGH